VEEREDEKGSFFANWTTMRHANLINGEAKQKKQSWISSRKLISQKQS